MSKARNISCNQVETTALLKHYRTKKKERYLTIQTVRQKILFISWNVQYAI